MPSPTADYVNLQFPSSLSVTAGEATSLIYGRIYEPGVTEAAGGASSVIAQLGYGPAGTDPTTSSAWVWVNASFSYQIGSDAEYQASLTVPTAGTYAYTYRFGIDNGVDPVVYTYADMDGAGTMPGLTFDPSQLGTLTVAAADPTPFISNRVFDATPTCEPGAGRRRRERRCHTRAGVATSSQAAISTSPRRHIDARRVHGGGRSPRCPLLRRPALRQWRPIPPHVPDGRGGRHCRRYRRGLLEPDVAPAEQRRHHAGPSPSRSATMAARRTAAQNTDQSPNTMMIDIA